ncbi:MAG: 3-hydroxyacyl-CoA dehydrogenase NAD-binding domain-containing protein [Pseudomonadota bacterium]
MPLSELSSQNGIGRPTVNTVGVVGLGVIGCSWTALIIAQGIDVVAYDPSSDAEKRAAAEIDAQEPALRALGLTAEQRGRFTMASSIEEVASQVDVIQENGPELLDAKRKLIAQISQLAPPDVVIASSTSGIMPSDFSSEAVAPERVLVGHPFLPVTIMPLVEVVGGQLTSPIAVNWASRYYEALGKKAVVLQRELPGFLANRFQVLVFEEALSLIERGAATVEDIEAIFTDGIGLRWNLFGPISLLTLAGGEAGIKDTWKRFSGHHSSVRDSIERLDNAALAISLVKEQSKYLSAANDPAGTNALRDRLLLAELKSRVGNGE